MVPGLRRKLGIRPVALYRYLGPQGQLQEQGQKVLGGPRWDGLPYARQRTPVVLDRAISGGARLDAGVRDDSCRRWCGRRLTGNAGHRPPQPRRTSSSTPWRGPSIYGQRRRITAREVYDQVNACSCLTRILACIVYWQAREISRMVAALDFLFDPDLLRHVSPN